MLNQEWKDRADDWVRELKKYIYIKLGNMDIEGFTTLEHITAKEAETRQFESYNPGQLWGRKWEYAWFKSKVVLPKEAEGKRIVSMFEVAKRPDYLKNVLVIDSGTDSLIYINGREAGCTRSIYLRNHILFYDNILITEKGHAGEEYNILAECYGGHGGAPTAVGPVQYGTEPYGEPPEYQNMMGNVSFGIWDEDAYQLYIDINTLMELRTHLDENSLRLAQIDDGIKKFTTIMDFEAPYDQLTAMLKEARKALEPLLLCANGTSAPTLYAFGHAHIDIAWLWTMAETERKCARTFAQQLMLIEKYPDYRFMQSSPWIFQTVKDKYPDLYERVQKAVKAGNLIPEGGMWVEADTNITGGESLIRQILYGKIFFKEEFGIDSKLVWLPDVFGFSANLPQIMKGCGMKYFATSKLGWRYHGGEPFPYTTFMWEGIDGSSVLTHLCAGYSLGGTPNSVSHVWKNRAQKENISSLMMPFGFGDGGGGPTMEHIEYVKRERDLEGLPKVRIEGPIEFFEQYNGEEVKERYTGELYLQIHRGTYTSQARTKKLNRQCEFALREAEMFGAFAGICGSGNFEYPANKFDSMWKKMLVNQFHDIIPGSSIAEVYQEANTDYENVLSEAENIICEADTGFIKEPGEGYITLFNSLSWDRSEYINGRFINIPSCGFTSIPKEPAPESRLGAAKVTLNSLENEFLTVKINESGEIESIFDKEVKREISSGICNKFMMYKDVPTRNDAWDIDSMYKENPCPIDTDSYITLCEEGIKVVRKINNSVLTQTISLKPESRRIDFDTEIDWQEKHKLLKVCFPVNIHANEALHDIQFGYYARPNHFSRQFDKDRFEVCAHKWTALSETNCGAAVINDCKYGVNVLGNSINLTLLKAPMAPDKNADKGINKFKYAFYVWNGGFEGSRLVNEAYEFNVPIYTFGGKAHEKSFLSLNSFNVVIETVKLAADGSGDMIIRLYEALAAHEHVSLNVNLPFKKAYFSNMIEEISEEIICAEDKRLEMDFSPFEIKTIRLSS